MKKKYLLSTVAMVCLLSFTGCSKEVVNEEVTLLIDNKNVTGLFNGTLKKGVPLGEGKIIGNEDGDEWLYEGEFENGTVIGKGVVHDYPIKITYEDIKYQGIYSGDMNDGKPDGKGEFTVDIGTENFKYDGEWTNGSIAGNGNVSEFPVKIFFQDNEYSGIYLGPITNSLPDGEGSFVVKTDEIEFEYEGNWEEGQLSGKGKLKTNHYLVKFPDVDRIGKYEGETLNGLADGEGEYAAVNGENVAYTYKGEWKNGMWHGQGIQRYDSEEYYVRSGTFSENTFTPTTVESLNSLGTYKAMSFALTEKAMSFLEEYDNLFPVDEMEGLEEHIDDSLSYEKMIKSPKEFGDKMIKLNNYHVIQIREDTYWDETVTVLILQEGSNYQGTTFYVYYPGQLSEIYANDKVDVYGLPLDNSSYKNVSGTTTKCYVLYGSCIKKKN